MLLNSCMVIGSENFISLLKVGNDDVTFQLKPFNWVFIHNSCIYNVKKVRILIFNANLFIIYKINLWDKEVTNNL